ncbi:uncharacterized protein LOC123540965 isoform X2 [Mercenaria mercenaria]|uniref:uncharacterized protein LOC123540965 isoform X2 n=1 Tax=Mercenaria mercenaria TaxID=6596 RepID=UPI00234F4078|nr:uncharacterized protein LOC123540965 isoform X2 [Mercenaria mercenaria]
MEEQINAIHIKIEETRNACRSMLKRITQMSEWSGCSELCNCLTLAENIDTNIRDMKRRVKHIEEKDRERDENINTLFQELNSMKRKQDSMQAQIGASTESIEPTPKSLKRNKDRAPQKSDKRRATRDRGAEYPVIDDGDDGHEKNFHLPENNETSITGRGNFSRKVNFTRTNERIPQNSMCTALVPVADATLVPISASLSELGEQQTKKEFYLSKVVWEVEAKAEVLNARKTEISELEGAKTILLLDTSASMANGDAWVEAHTFVMDYLKGLEQIAPRVSNKEYVSIVTYGSQTRCLQRYTNDFASLRAAVESVQLGGPSPLYGGLLMAHAVAVSPKNEEFKLINGMQVNTKIVLITDGEPTELCLHRGSDIADQDKMDETKASLINEVGGLHKRDIDLFCVPVGNANMEFLNLILSKEQGRRVLNFRDGVHFSRRLFLSNKFLPSFALFGGGRFAVPRGDPEITGRDFAHMQEILDDDRSKIYDAMLRQDQNPYEESRNERVLPIGTRVRRGPDWNGEDHDGNGPGTVVGHHLYRDMVWVHWDENDEIRQYNYGHLDQYTVFQVEEPRIPLPGQPLDVGCVVCPGKDWQSDVTEPGSTGVVYRMQVNEDGIRKAVVRWDNGQRAVHSYGDDRIYEIQIYLGDASVVQALQNTGKVSGIRRTERKAVTTLPAVRKFPTNNPALKVQSQKAKKNKNVH